ncbi:hypothetical protein [Streptomyces sp. JHA26]|uniref:hypothetical protein n=1 Tax=Streptomyces sp. JHA26 TaxID=1917143 RepID=UPI00117FA162|nr:hypothetical protein [Streptomyces sp. JHA26]
MENLPKVHTGQEDIGGRLLPGRPDRPAGVVSSGEAVPPSPADPTPPAPTSGTRTEGSAGPVLKILPLGSGLVLVGLGLALAFVGLRLRRSGA